MFTTGTERGKQPRLFAYGRGYIDTISNPIHNTNECTLCERQSCAFPEFSAVCTCREIVGGLRKKLWANWRIHTGNSHPGPNHNHMYYIIIGQRRPYLNGAPCKSMKPRYWYQFCTLWKRWGTPSTSASRNLLIISERDPENSPECSEFLYVGSAGDDTGPRKGLLVAWRSRLQLGSFLLHNKKRIGQSLHSQRTMRFKRR